MEELATSSANGNPYFGYRKLLDCISTRLQKENALRLANLYSLPSWYYEIGQSHDPSYALRVLIAMEGKGVFAPDNLKGLIEALKNIQREDLRSTVKDFIKLKYEQGVSQECMRRQTHPQDSDIHPSPYPKVRPSSNIVYYGATSSLNSPHLYHSTSLCSIAVDTHDTQGSEETNGLRTRSRPDFNVYSREEQTGENGLAANPPTQPFSSAVCNPISVASFQLVLLSAESLLRQIDLLSNTAVGCVPPVESTPVKENEQKLLRSSLTSTRRVVHNLRQLSGRMDSHAEAKDRLFSHSSSYATNISRMSSLGSESMGVDRDLQLDSIRSEAVAIFKDSSKHKEKRLKKDSVSAPRPDSMHPMPKLTSQSSPAQHNTVLISSATSPQAISTSPTTTNPLPHFITRSRHRSRKEDKKTNKHGILIWNLKVKKLKNLLLQQGSKIESEEFYDNAKRPLRASLSPHGLGQDSGNHMTLMIQCLEEPKSGSIPNLEIVVNVIDPHSDSEVPTVRPIRRSLERRGIRLVQQFLAHSTVDNFKCSYIAVSIAIVGRQVESEDSDVDV